MSAEHQSPLRFQIAPAPFNDRYERIFGSQLKPEDVTAVLKLADSGYLQQLADLLDECRERDGHLHAVLERRELRVAGAHWRLVAPEGSGVRGSDIAKWCTDTLKELEQPDDLALSFEESMAALMTAIYHGRYGLEIVWTNRKNWFVPRYLTMVHPRRFTYAADWRLHVWDASGTATNLLRPSDLSMFGKWPGVPVASFPSGKWIIHRARFRGAYPTRAGLGRLLVWFAAFKRWGWRDFLALAQRTGRGLRIGRYASGLGPMGKERAAPEDVQELEDAVEAVSSTVSAIIADSTEIEIKDATHDNDIHDRLIRICDAEQSKAVLGGTLGTEVSIIGTRSMGEVHERNELVLARGDASSISSTLEAQLLGPMVLYNFGRTAPVPKLEISVDPEKDLEKLAERMERWVRMGGTLGNRSSRAALRLPSPEADETLVGWGAPR